MPLIMLQARYLFLTLPGVRLGVRIGEEFEREKAKVLAA
jgi:hypothetical protein